MHLKVKTKIIKKWKLKLNQIQMMIIIRKYSKKFQQKNINKIILNLKRKIIYRLLNKYKKLYFI
jgi:hypothetical protein